MHEEKDLIVVDQLPVRQGFHCLCMHRSLNYSSTENQILRNFEFAYLINSDSTYLRGRLAEGCERRERLIVEAFI